jgi:hypothetical protein
MSLQGTRQLRGIRCRIYDVGFAHKSLIVSPPQSESHCQSHNSLDTEGVSPFTFTSIFH